MLNMLNSFISVYCIDKQGLPFPVVVIINNKVQSDVQINCF